MNNTIGTQRCKRVKFKNNQASRGHGSTSNNKQINISIQKYNCQLSTCPRPTYLLIFILMLSCLSPKTKANAIHDRHRSRLDEETKNSEVGETVLAPRPDTICNQGGPHECVCNRSLGDLDNKLLLCDRIIEVGWGVATNNSNCLGKAFDSRESGYAQHKLRRQVAHERTLSTVLSTTHSQYCQ